MTSATNWRNEAERRLALIRELRRRECRTSFGAWCEEALAPSGLKPAHHHRVLIKELQDVADGKVKRLLVHLPPGSAKSTFVSKLFPPYMLARFPNLPIVGASNTSELAETFSRNVMGYVRDNARTLGYGLARETAVNWSTTNGGSYRAVGIGGVITGFRAGCAIIDDPTRSRADAESETLRDKQWDWFTGDLRTRMKPDAPIVVVMTRWHPDDIGGRLLERQPGLWRVVSIPAIAEENDPLGREIGQWLWDDDEYGYAAELKRAFAEYEAAGAMRDWAALYQQRPVSAEGNLFKTHMIETLDVAPVCVAQARAWDLAATRQMGTRNPDWTAGARLGRMKDGRFVILDMVRLREGPDDVEAAIVNTAAADGYAATVGLPQDPGQAGKQQVLYLTRKLSGHRVDSSPETGDKATRAAPFASQVNVGNVCMVRGPWNGALMDEMASFPGGVKDDQIDALSRAFGLVSGRAPMLIAPSAYAKGIIRPPMRIAR